jgi:hypothetical protein
MARGLLTWHMYAGGISAASGKHGYSAHTAHGQYQVQPVTTKWGRHRGYLVHFINDKGELRGGLWQELGLTYSPNEGKRTSKAHYLKHFSKNGG